MKDTDQVGEILNPALTPDASPAAPADTTLIAGVPTVDLGTMTQPPGYHPQAVAGREEGRTEPTRYEVAIASPEQLKELFPNNNYTSIVRIHSNKVLVRIAAVDPDALQAGVNTKLKAASAHVDTCKQAVSKANAKTLNAAVAALVDAAEAVQALAAQTGVLVAIATVRFAIDKSGKVSGPFFGYDESYPQYMTGSNAALKRITDAVATNDRVAGNNGGTNFIASMCKVSGLSMFPDTNKGSFSIINGEIIGDVRAFCRKHITWFKSELNKFPVANQKATASATPQAATAPPVVTV